MVKHEATRRLGQIADALLISIIVVAPLAGGSSRLEMLPILAVIGTLACAAAMLASSRPHRCWPAIVLAGLALFTLAQALPLPDELLRIISPRASSLRAFVLDQPGSSPLSYEPAASARDAARLLIAAMVAQAAFERALARHSEKAVIVAVVVAGVASGAAALVHRLLGIEPMLGILPALVPASTLMTTFVNANHGAGFMALATVSALGLAIGAQRRSRATVCIVAAAISATVSALCLSRGGLLNLALALVGLLAISGIRRARGKLRGRTRNPALIIASLVAASVVFAWHAEELMIDFVGTPDDPLRTAGKIAAMRDAIPLILDHPIFGIGRGSYPSAYAAYKASDFQVTFTHPENIAVELLADWGLVVGTAALASLVWVIAARIARTTSPSMLGALVGIATLALQNLVDFSLELPGVAIPVAALLGASGTAATRSRHSSADRRWGMAVAIVVLPAIALFVATVGAFSLGDLGRDLEALDEEVRQHESGSKEDARATLARVTPIAARHPANAAIAARIAYIAETGTPPDLKEAIRWTNRALYLAPTYADAHLLVGRLLVGAGHRDQGFVAMQRGLELVGPGRLPNMVRLVGALARSVEEVRLSIPRRDAEQDILDDSMLATFALELHRSGRSDWARDLLRSLGDIEALPPESLRVLGIAAQALGELDVAERAISRHLQLVDDDLLATRRLVAVLTAKGETARASELIASTLARPGIDPIPFLRQHVQLALSRGEIAVARASLAAVAERAAPTAALQFEIARLEAAVEQRDRHPRRAIRALERALRISPEAWAERLSRAQLLLKVGRSPEARLELESVIKLAPQSSVARALLDRLQSDVPAPEAEAGSDDE